MNMANLIETEEERMLAGAARRFLDDLAPVSHLRQMRDRMQTHDPDLWYQMSAMGWAGVLVPEQAGGDDMGFSAAMVIAHELGKTLVISPFLSTSVIAATALRQVSGSQATEALASIASGGITYALAIDEGAKFAPEASQLRARRDGNGYVLDGQKTFVVDGSFADRLLVLARTDNGQTLFDLDAERPGIRRDRMKTIDSRDAATIRFDGVRADFDNVLGHFDDAMTVLAPAIRAGQAALAAEMSGLAAAAFGMTVGYLKERRQFGVAIGSFQALQHRAAILWSELELTASAILNAGRMLDQDLDNAQLAVSLAKARATATAKLAVAEAVQMHGGIGMTDAFDIGFYMKRARVSAEWLGDYSYHAEQIAQLRGI